MPTARKEALLAIGLGAIGVYLMMALCSYHPMDPSGFAAAIPEHDVKNLSGKRGADLAAGLFFYFGLVGFVVVLPLFQYAFLYLKKRPKPRPWVSSLSWFLAVFVFLTMIPELRSHILWDGTLLPSAGFLGGRLHHFVQEQFGPMGHYLSVVTILLLVLGWHFAEAQLWRRFKGLFKRSQQDSPAAPSPARPSPTFVFEEPPVLRQAFPREVKPLSSPNTEVPASYVPPPQTSFKMQGVITHNAAEIEALKRTAQEIEATFHHFGIDGQVTDFKPGPAVTIFEFKPEAGTKLAKINSLTDDIAMSLKVDAVFIHPITGKDLVGIQVPNSNRKTVYFGDIIASPAFHAIASPLAFAMGQSLSGDPVCESLEEMPHLLMAGQTGSGKSVAINSVICSMLMKATPEEVRFIFVDPKILELKVYEGIPHLLMPVITEPDKASAALAWLTGEMDRRYRLMEDAKVRHIRGFNAEGGQAHPLPYIVVIIDELADLMLMAPKDVENSIQRLAQKARACGIHLILATQRPSVDVITGVIKANLPSRIAFKVFSRGDSRTILDANGADKLLGKGDMLYLKSGRSRLERIQGAFLSDEEVIAFVGRIKAGSEPSYDKEAMAWIESKAKQDGPGEAFVEGDLDPKWDEAIRIAQGQGHISASYLQRQLKIGYNRAARVIETMEQQHLVGPADGVKPRKWLGSGDVSL